MYRFESDNDDICLGLAGLPLTLTDTSRPPGRIENIACTWLQTNQYSNVAIRTPPIKMIRSIFSAFFSMISSTCFAEEQRVVPFSVQMRRARRPLDAQNPRYVCLRFAIALSLLCASAWLCTIGRSRRSQCSVFSPFPRMVYCQYYYR